MPFSTNCNNKGCGKFMEPYLDPDTNKVYCSLCELEISNITHFTKIQMKSNKQYRQRKSQKFSVKCGICKADEQPKIINDIVICGACEKPLNNITNIFKNMLKMHLNKKDDNE